MYLLTYFNTDQSISNACSTVNVDDMSKTGTKCAGNVASAPPSPLKCKHTGNYVSKNIEHEIENVEVKFKTLDILEKKVDNFENYLKKNVAKYP